MVHVEEEDLRALDPHLESFWNINTAEDLQEAERRLKTHLF
jgi:molybdopterin-guanine dinucleotide biosynthesis protein A